MKLFILLSAFISFNAMAFPFVYDCQGDLDYIVTVKSKTQVTIADEDNRDKDQLGVDVTYMNANPDKKSVRLTGSASTMGDGEEGYTVYVTMSKVMLSGSRFGYVNKTGYGPDGSYQDSFKCSLKN